MTKKPLDITVLISAFMLAIAAVAASAGMGRVSDQPDDQLQDQGGHQPEPAAVSFKALDIIIDSGDAQLAAYQFELNAPDGVTLVGVENGEHAAFASAPHYDPAALGSGRIIVAAFNTSGELPTGKTRVCRLHVQESGEAMYDIKLTAAADAAGNRIDADITIYEE